MGVTRQQKEKVRQLLKNGRKLEAIKYVREQFGLDLRQAKLLVEEVEETLPVDAASTVSNIPSQRPTGCFLWIFVVIGAGFLSAAIWLFVINYQKKENGILVIGRVVEYPSQPTIAYEVGGEVFHYYSDVSSEPPSYEIGEEVEVYVDPDYPENAMVNTFTESYLLSTIFMVIGLPFFF